MGAWRGRFVLLLFTLAVVLGQGKGAVDESFYGPGELPTTMSVVIPPGGSATAAAALFRAHALRYPLMFRAATWFTRSEGPIHAGEFRIPARSSIAGILHILRHGAPVQHQVTLPEGLTGAEIARILNTIPAATGRVPLPPDGDVLPQTYDYILGTPRSAILARAEKALRTVLAAEWAARSPTVPLSTPQDALTLASIVQQETPLASELPEIAAVYENRLVRGMKLQADPTVIYAATYGQTSGGVGISRADLVSRSAYNTYRYAGLPPGPICAPGIAAIAAVLHPAASDALYFVATGQGGHVFTADFKDQLRNIEAYDARKQALLFVNKKKQKNFVTAGETTTGLHD